MKRNTKKIVSFLAVLLLLIAVMMPMVSASKDPLEWTLSEDEQTLSDGVNTYTFYKTIPYAELETREVYVYADTMELSVAGTCDLCVNPNISDIVWLESYDEIFLYATDAGKQKLDAWFVNREIGGYRVWSEGLAASLDKSLLDSMNAAVEAQAAMRTVRVSDLANLSRYEIYAHDTNELFAKSYGVVYRMTDGGYYYVNYGTLDNSYFDADGNFSYREGTVTLTLLDETLTAEFVETLELANEDFLPDYTWEGSMMNLDFGVLPAIIFWIFYVLVGFLVPVPFLVLGIVFANVRKWGRPKYWYFLSVFSLLWELFAMLLAIVLILCSI